VKSSIRDTCDQRLPPTLPILAPTLRTAIEGVEVSLALPMHRAFSRRATRFRGSTRFTLRRFLPQVKRCFPPARPRMVESSIEPTSDVSVASLSNKRPLAECLSLQFSQGRFHRPFVKMSDFPDPKRLSSIDRIHLFIKEALVRDLLFKEGSRGEKRGPLFKEARWNRDGSRTRFRISWRAITGKRITLLRQSFPVDADLAILPPRFDVQRHVARRGLPLLG